VLLYKGCPTELNFHITEHHVADVSLTEKGNKESFGFNSSLALDNPSFMKGNQLTRRVAICSKGGGGVTACTGSWKRPSAHEVHNLLGGQVVMRHIFFAVWTATELQQSFLMSLVSKGHIH
jgi:hypothetical protein